MSPRFSIGLKRPEEPYPCFTLGILARMAIRLGLILGAVLTGLALWLGRHAEIGTTIDLSRPTAFAPKAPQAHAPGRLPDRRREGNMNQPRNLSGRVVMVSPLLCDGHMTKNSHMFEMLCMKPEDATRDKIAELLGIPVEKVALDQPLFELLVAEIHPEVKAGLIAELGTESATPRDIQTAVRSLGIEDNALFVFSRRVPVTLRVLQHGYANPEVKALLHAAQVYAWNVLSFRSDPLPENHSARLVTLPFPGLPAYLESNLRSLQPGALPQSDRQAAAAPASTHPGARSARRGGRPPGPQTVRRNMP
jgi:hypothetical protein